MYRFLVVFISLLFNLVCKSIHAQNQLTPEALLEQASVEKADSSKTLLMVKAADAYFRSGKKNEMLRIVEDVRIILRKNEYLPARVELYRMLGIYYYGEGKKEARHLYADSMIDISKKQRYKQGEAKGLLAKGIAFSMEENMQAATAPLETAQQLFQHSGDDYNEALTLKVIAANLGTLGRDKECIRVSNIAAEKFVKAGYAIDAGLVYTNIVWMYMVEGQLDSAVSFNIKADEIAAKTKTPGRLHFLIALRKADIASRLGDFKTAEEAIFSADRLASQLKLASMSGSIYFVKANIERGKGNYKAALEYDLLAEEVHRRSGNTSQLSEQLNSLAKDYEKLGQTDKALAYYKRYQHVKDSLLDERTDLQLNELNIKYETAQREKAIAEKDLAISKKNERMNTLIISLAAVILGLALLAVIYIQRRKAYKQSMVNFKKEQDISLLKALMTGEEKERSRLARDLHDGLGGMLAAAQMQISQLKTERQADIENAAELVRKASTESRRIAHNLLPETLVRYGLNETLKQYCQSITTSKVLQVDYESIGIEEKLPYDIELSVYRIIQELVNNIIKHAEATESFVQVQKAGQQLSITVEDNGKGFLADTVQNNGIGLGNIQTRVSYVGGKMNIKSDEQNGTSVFIEIQIKGNE